MTISNQTFKKQYEFLLTERGQPTHTTPVSPEIIQSWVGKLPNTLLYTWQELGWCCFNQGLLWTVNPDEYKYVVDTWLEGTPYQTMDNFHCFARTAFGECYLYGENRRGFIKIMPQFNTIWADDRKLAKPQSVEDAEYMLYLKLEHDNEDYDMENGEGELFFERALEKLGELKADEMYAFEPFLRLLPEEKMTLEHLIKVRMDIYTDMLYQFEPPTSRGSSFSDIYR